LEYKVKAKLEKEHQYQAIDRSYPKYQFVRNKAIALLDDNKET